MAQGDSSVQHGRHGPPPPAPSGHDLRPAPVQPGARLAHLLLTTLSFQGFFCKTEDDFDDWCQQVKKVGGSSPSAWTGSGPVGAAPGRLRGGVGLLTPATSAPPTPTRRPVALAWSLLLASLRNWTGLLAGPRVAGAGPGWRPPLLSQRRLQGGASVLRPGGLCAPLTAASRRQLSLLGGALPMFELVEQQPSHLACPDVLNLSLGEPRPRPRGHLSGGAVVPPVMPRGACDAAVCLSLAPQAQRQLLLTFKICMNPTCDHWVTSVCHVGPGTLPSVPCSPWVQQPDPPFFAPRAAAWPHTRGSEWLPTGPGAP